MNYDVSIRLEEHTFQISQLKSLSTIEQLDAYPHLPTYAQEVLTFCHQWLKGTSVFRLQTSGSTGKPKQIKVTREQMTASARMTANKLALQAGYRALLCLSAAYIAGKMMLVRALEVGMDVTVVPPSADPLSGIIEPIDFMAVVPLQLKSLLEAEDPGKLEQLNGMKAIIVGGGAVGQTLERSIKRQLRCPVYSTYGMTETVSHIALRRLNGAEATDLYHILPGIKVGQDSRGCLMIRGAVTQDQWLTTNDIVEIEDQRHFRWLGRADHVINSGGIKIHTEQLEKKLEQGVLLLGTERQYFVAGVDDERLGSKVCLFVEGKAPDAARLRQLQEWTEAHLTPYERPRQVFFVERFALTSTGKIKRNESIAAAISQQ